MKPKPEKPLVLGITPVGMGCFGFLVIFAVLAGLPEIFRMVAWIMRWLGL